MKHNQNGGINALLVPFVLAVVLLVATLAFGGWAYTSRQDYKTNVDKKIAAAVEVAKQQESTEKDKQFAEADKQPLKTYTGPEAFGSLVVKYPKTWSSYVDDSGNSGSPVNGYFHPGTVPSINAQGISFALRVEVVGQSYKDVLSNLSSRQKSGALKIDAYSLPQVPSVVGIIVNGQIEQGKTTTMVVLPLRDKTIKISTQGDQFRSDFNTLILPNLSFSP